jgi:hypothetical protein
MESVAVNPPVRRPLLLEFLFSHFGFGSPGPVRFGSSALQHVHRSLAIQLRSVVLSEARRDPYNNNAQWREVEGSRGYINVPCCLREFSRCFFAERMNERTLASGRSRQIPLSDSQRTPLGLEHPFDASHHLIMADAFSIIQLR